VLDVVRFSQDDVDSAPVRPPAGQGRLPPEIIVSVVDSPEVLGLELVLRRTRSRVPLPPKGLDEEVAFPVGLQLLEDLFLERRDDVDDLLLQPLLVKGREVLFLIAAVRGVGCQTGEGKK
jgi:hypothetical protein